MKRLWLQRWIVYVVVEGDSYGGGDEGKEKGKLEEGLVVRTLLWNLKKRESIVWEVMVYGRGSETMINFVGITKDTLLE